MTFRSKILAGSFFLLGSYSTLTFAASSDTAGAASVSFSEGELLFKPLVADTYEPRAGMLAQIGKNRLRLDIGNSIDLISYSAPTDSVLAAIGADFFTYTLLRGERNFHFPVDASDYFFGINFSARKRASAGDWFARLRVSHISAHFVDGHYDNTQAAWKDMRPPVVYSREFLEGVIAFEPASLKDILRIYGGATYLFHVDPRNLPRFIGEAGIEGHDEFAPHLSIYCAYQLTVLKISETSARHDVEVGLKVGRWEGRGLVLYGSFFSGYSIHGEYYNVKDNYFALGFRVDL